MDNSTSKATNEDKKQENQKILMTVSSNITAQFSQKQKSKKLNSNRRKKQKMRQKKNQARQQLQEIIRDIYCHNTDFNSRYQEINALLEVDLDEDRFYQFINQAIREEVDLMAEQMHRIIAELCEQIANDDGIAIEKIRELGLILDNVQETSLQIQKIINLFHSKFEEVNQEQNWSYLHIQTLRHIIQQDPYKQDFEQFCITFIQQTQNEQIKNIISNILEIYHVSAINNFKEQLYESGQRFMQSQYSKIVTAETEIERQQIQGGQQKKKKKKRRKKNKKKQTQTQTNIQSLEEKVIKKLQNMTIDKKQRIYCTYREEWLQTLKQKIQTIT